MEPEMQNAIVVLAFVIAVAVIAQTIILLAFLVTFRRWYNRTGQVLEDFNRNAEPVLRAARDLLVDGKEKLEVISGTITEILQLTKTQVSRVEEVVADASDRARLQMIRLDQLAGETMRRLEDTMEEVQRSILAPIRELAALLAGVRSAVEFLFRRNKSKGEPIHQDEELFI